MFNVNKRNKLARGCFRCGSPLTSLPHELQDQRTAALQSPVQVYAISAAMANGYVLISKIPEE